MTGAAIVAIVACGALFAAFGLLRPRAGCGGCTGCGAVCAKTGEPRRGGGEAGRTESFGERRP